ncbi:hypothetical protein R3P38DRAFT_2909803 [Favolaschia claudopus]|uniref:SHSP domain-containing protein n=1 Tax=Favolaschia claudopus TaxID=2862362 RepID=A0AAW0C899_9AGAR
MYSQQGEYPDEYAAPSTSTLSPNDHNYQWDQQDNPQIFEQMLDQPQQQPLSLPGPPPPHPSQQYQHLQEPPQLVPTQIPQRGSHDNAPVRLHHVQPPARSPPVEIQPVMLQMNTAARQTNTAARQTAPASRGHVRHHPYARTPSDAHSRQEIDVQHRPRLPDPAQSPAATNPTFTPPMSEYHHPLQQQQPSPPFSSTSPGAVPNGPSTPFVPSRPPHAPPAATPDRQYFIRVDTQYDPATFTLTAMLELPGLQKSDLRVVLATTLHNHVRHVTVTGRSRPSFTDPPTASILRERKHGLFTRTLPVPPETKVCSIPLVPLRLTRLFFVCQRFPFSIQLQDVDAQMENGVLVLRISCGPPAPSALEHLIPIR